MTADKVLLVVDWANSTYIEGLFQQAGMKCIIARDPQEAEDQFRLASMDAVVFDLAILKQSVETLITLFRSITALLPIVMLGDDEDLQAAADGIQRGADQILHRGNSPEVIAAILRHLLEVSRNRRRQFAEEESFRLDSLNPLAGKSESVLKLARLAHETALIDSPVLIRGESGTGKRDLARQIHEKSSRRLQAFASLECDSALALARGSTSAREEIAPEGTALRDWTEKLARALDIARRGTLLLRGAPLMGHPERQAIARWFITNEEAIPVSAAPPPDVRLIALSERSTGEHLMDFTFSGMIRSPEKTVVLTVPPLRDHIEDLPDLCADILQKFSGQFSCRSFKVSAAALGLLKSHSWPGNLMELRNALERAAMNCEGSLLGEKHFTGVADNFGGVSEVRPLHEIERKYIEHALASEGGRVVAAAKKLGIPRSSLYHKLKQYQIDRSEFRPSSARSEGQLH